MATQPDDGTRSTNRTTIAAAVINALGGIAAAVAGAVVGAVAGAVVGYNAGTTATPAVTTTVTVTSTVTSKAAPASSTRPEPETPGPTTTERTTATGTVRFHGTVALEDTIAHIPTDLDLEQPTKAADYADGDVFNLGIDGNDATVNATENNSLVARWTGSGTPDFDQCRKTAVSEGVISVPEVRRGSILCVRTGDNRIARLKVIEIVKRSSVRADTIVWNERVA